MNSKNGNREFDTKKAIAALKQEIDFSRRTDNNNEKSYSKYNSVLALPKRQKSISGIQSNNRNQNHSENDQNSDPNKGIDNFDIREKEKSLEKTDRIREKIENRSENILKKMNKEITEYKLKSKSIGKYIQNKVFITSTIKDLNAYYNSRSISPVKESVDLMNRSFSNILKTAEVNNAGSENVNFELIQSIKNESNKNSQIYKNYDKNTPILDYSILNSREYNTTFYDNDNSEDSFRERVRKFSITAFINGENKDVYVDFMSINNKDDFMLKLKGNNQDEFLIHGKSVNFNDRMSNISKGKSNSRINTVHSVKRSMSGLSQNSDMFNQKFMNKNFNFLKGKEYKDFYSKEKERKLLKDRTVEKLKERKQAIDDLEILSVPLINQNSKILIHNLFGKDKNKHNLYMLPNEIRSLKMLKKINIEVEDPNKYKIYLNNDNYGKIVMLDNISNDELKVKKAQSADKIKHSINHKNDSINSINLENINLKESISSNNTNNINIYKLKEALSKNSQTLKHNTIDSSRDNEIHAIIPPHTTTNKKIDYYMFKENKVSKNEKIKEKFYINIPKENLDNKHDFNKWLMMNENWQLQKSVKLEIQRDQKNEIDLNEQKNFFNPKINQTSKAKAYYNKRSANKNEALTYYDNKEPKQIECKNNFHPQRIINKSTKQLKEQKFTKLGSHLHNYQNKYNTNKRVLDKKYNNFSFVPKINSSAYEKMIKKYETTSISLEDTEYQTEEQDYKNNIFKQNQYNLMNQKNPQFKSEAFNQFSKNDIKTIFNNNKFDKVTNLVDKENLNLNYNYSNDIFSDNISFNEKNYKYQPDSDLKNKGNNRELLQTNETKNLSRYNFINRN